MPISNAILFIDEQVENCAQLADEFSSHDVHILRAGRSGLAQMAEVLAGRAGLDALHVLSHGAPAAIQLGTDVISPASLADDLQTLKAVGGALRPQGDILFYACEAGANPLPPLAVGRVGGGGNFHAAASSAGMTPG